MCRRGRLFGATWNPELVEEVGALLGRETRFKAARVLLAPTVNLHRSPLAGRNFECFSEDPLLSGVLAAAYIRGVQSEGVVTTVKHFVGNECETDRHTSNSIIDDRALRELYLLPFEYAVKEGGTLGVMSSYNRLNGRYCNEQKWLLTDVLRDEWGFEGFVVTDWFAGAFTESAAEAGLDIEMPAGDRIFGSVLAEAVRDGRVPESTLDRIAGRLLSVFERIGAFDDEPEIEQSIDLPEHRELARRAAADAIVLLRNESVDASSLLPLSVDQLTSIAVIGPNAGRAQIMGGGSANLRPFHRTSPLDALRARLGDSVTVTYAEGCNIDKVAPLLTGSEIRTPDGEQGFALDVFDNRNWEGEPIAQDDEGHQPAHPHRRTGRRSQADRVLGSGPGDIHTECFRFVRLRGRAGNAESGVRRRRVGDRRDHGATPDGFRVFRDGIGADDPFDRAHRRIRLRAGGGDDHSRRESAGRSRSSGPSSAARRSAW